MCKLWAVSQDRQSNWQRSNIAGSGSSPTAGKLKELQLIVPVTRSNGANILPLPEAQAAAAPLLQSIATQSTQNL